MGDAKWDIQAEWQFRAKGNPPPPDTRIKFSLELSSIDADWQTAIASARKLEPALVDGVPARIELHTVELHFSSDVDQTEPYGDATFFASIDQPIPFPRPLDDAAFVTALAQAVKLAGNLPIQADEIEQTERYWIFPIHQIGANGVIVDRTTGHAFLIAGSMDHSMWIWAYEHRLLEEPAGDLIIEQVLDSDRAFAALRQFTRVIREDLETLPLVLKGCATWMAAKQLKEANTALSWRVAPRSE